MHSNADCPQGACPECFAPKTASAWSEWLTSSFRKLKAATKVFRTSSDREVPEAPDLASQLAPPKGQSRIDAIIAGFGDASPIGQAVDTRSEGSRQPTTAEPPCLADILKEKTR